jgi:hypothetical protein
VFDAKPPVVIIALLLFLRAVFLTSTTDPSPRYTAERNAAIDSRS